MSKTAIFLEVKDHNGNIIGHFVKTISARELWQMRIMRKMFNDSIENNPKVFRTPIIEDNSDND